MPAQIISINSGINTCYLIREQGAIMIDGGPPGMKDTFLKRLKEYSIDPKELKLIVLTHADFDHVGSVEEIRKTSDAKIAIHQNDRQNLEQGIFNWTKGATTWGKISRAILMPLLKKRMSFTGVKPELILNDDEISLKKYGINGRILYTPGHTLGSVSVLLDSGDAFIGCLAHNRLPFTFHPALPIYAENIQLIKESWKKLINEGAKTAYPGHGKPFSVELMKKYIN